MGGGAAMRAAARLTATPPFTGVFRSGGATENTVAVAARNAVMRPVSATVCEGGQLQQSIQRPAWELDEWEFAHLEDEQNEVLVRDKNGGGVDMAAVLPRVVFGPVPTIEETKEATSELKDALEKVYFSSPRSSGSGESVSSFHETKACISQEASAPNGAIQAFMLLKENPVAQTVVASIASDPNVWVAVMQNPAFAEFLESDRKFAESQIQDPETSSVDSESATQTPTKSSLDNDNAEKAVKPDGFMGFIDDVKVTVVDMVSNLTSFVESLFTVSDAEKNSFDSPKSLFAGGTFMALAMMVIMVVLMKRN
ncbi:uncharacterized protein LOC141656454 [Silene latifolia]|uniref:uncharacterized protein LOC141656454 n=1 Tax=Silene latifolia TaxID=37657 RepID=UPI003D77F6E1